MIRKLLSSILGTSSASVPPQLPVVSRDGIASLLVMDANVPQVHLAKLEAWLESQRMPNDEIHRRAVAAAWLDAVRDALAVDHLRLRTANTEAIVPRAGAVGVDLSAGGERAIAVIHDALRKIRDDAPIRPNAIVAIAPTDAFIDFTSHFFSEDSHTATFGGLYIREGTVMPLLAINAMQKGHVLSVLAHELTHHALRDARLPLWIEEGLTQMMEERVTGLLGFTLTESEREEHANEWTRDALQEFVEGASFFSPEGDRQRLAYHLAQWFSRACLTTQPDRYFAFARACVREDWQAAFRTQFRASPVDALHQLVHGG